jgi:hypothetical protein
VSDPEIIITASGIGYEADKIPQIVLKQRSEGISRMSEAAQRKGPRVTLPLVDVLPAAEEIHITAPTVGTWLVRWRRIGHGFETQHFDTWEPVADWVRRLLMPR